MWRMPRQDSIALSLNRQRLQDADISGLRLSGISGMFAWGDAGPSGAQNVLSKEAHEFAPLRKKVNMSEWVLRILISITRYVIS